VKACDSDFSPISGLSTFSYVDSAGAIQRDVIVLSDGVCLIMNLGGSSSVSYPLLGEGSDTIISEAGDDIIFDFGLTTTSGYLSTAHRVGNLFIADTTLKKYDPLTSEVVTIPEAPTGQPLVCAYRDRIVLAGENHIWYACRTGDHADWAFGDNAGDAERAVAGQLETAGRVGVTITAMIPNGDASLLFATQNSLWLLRGDPATGSMVKISDEVGVIAQGAWDVSPKGVLAFVGAGGLYLYPMGSTESPVAFSAERIPNELQDIDVSANTVTVVYDADGEGFNVSVTPTDGSAGDHFWVDLESKAIWPVAYQDGHQPIAAAKLYGAGTSKAVLGCYDGYLRTFDDDATDDDGEDIESHVLIGPVRLTSEDLSDGLLSEIHGVLGDGSGSVEWGVIAGPSAEAAEASAVAAVGGDTSAVSASGTFGELRGSTNRPRVRGPWVVIWLHSTAAWAYEAVVLAIQQLGRLRV
jgi:hypothetical protein